MSPKNFDRQLDPLANAARKLHQTISSPFEGDQITEGYQAGLDLPVSRQSDFFTLPTYNDYVQLSTGYAVNARKDWKVQLGYDTAAREIGVAGLSLPLTHPEKDVSLLFRCTERQGFMRFLVKGNPDNFDVLPSPFNQIEPVSPSFIGHVLLSAGYDFRNFSTHPDKLRLELASLVDGSNNATVTEKVRTMSADGIKALFTRTTRCTPKGASRRSRTSGADYASAVEATLAFAHQDPKVHEQLVVSYDYADFIIGLPRIVKRVVTSRDSILTQQDLDDFEVVKETKIPVNAHTMGRLADDMVDVLPRY